MWILNKGKLNRIMEIMEIDIQWWWCLEGLILFPLHLAQLEAVYWRENLMSRILRTEIKVDPKEGS